MNHKGRAFWGKSNFSSQRPAGKEHLSRSGEFALARAQWKELKDLGFAVTYWQQGANGRWEMKS